MTKDDNHHLSPRQIETVSGLVAGFSSTVVTHPLDVIKIRLQLSPSSRDDMKQPFLELKKVISKIQQTATIEYQQSLAKHQKLNSKWLHTVHQYYRGLTPNLVGNISAWSIYFTLYAELKNHIDTRNKTVDYFVLSSIAGVSTSLLTNPLWVLKTRILGTTRNEANAYKSARDGVKQILKSEGVRGFWKGTLPSMFLVFQGSLQFTFYDLLKSFLHGETNETLTTQQFIYASALSKILSMSIMYPLQVVRSRLQNYNESRNILLVCKHIWFHENKWHGFYKGFGPNLVRVVPVSCITLVSYETVKKVLSP